jgi:16S rRNA C967 or C1407 C5-methylase (RsmB/RsmF family)
MGSKKKLPPEEAFDRFYREMYPARWEDLKKALLKEGSHAELAKGLLKPYYLNPASLAPVELLFSNGMNNHALECLDMCAAPGGKTLAIALTMPAGSSLVSNDRSSARRSRLHQVINSSLPEELCSQIRISGHDASKWGLYEQNRYDRILLDAPCSSEEHVLKDPKYLAQWSVSRTKVLAANQYAMLAAALTALKPGGILVYSTCSVSQLENDAVIEKLLNKAERSKNGKKKIGFSFEIQTVSWKKGEATEYGWQIWPDQAPGYGPIYLSKIKKI